MLTAPVTVWDSGWECLNGQHLTKHPYPRDGLGSGITRPAGRSRTGGRAGVQLG